MAGVSAFGATLSIGADLVGELTNLTGPGMSREIIDLSNHDSTNWMEQASGLSDPGEVGVEGNFTNDAGQDAMLDHFEDKDLASFTVTLGTGATWAFDGFVTAFSVTAPHDGKLGFSATIKISGEPEYADPPGP